MNVKIPIQSFVSPFPKHVSVFRASKRGFHKQISLGKTKISISKMSKNIIKHMKGAQSRSLFPKHTSLGTLLVIAPINIILKFGSLGLISPEALKPSSSRTLSLELPNAPAREFAGAAVDWRS